MAHTDSSLWNQHLGSQGPLLVSCEGPPPSFGQSRSAAASQLGGLQPENLVCKERKESDSSKYMTVEDGKSHRTSLFVKSPLSFTAV